MCVKFIPGWTNLLVDDLSIDLLCGGSGAFVAKISTTAEVLPKCVAFKSGSSDISAIALKGLTASGAESFCGKCYLAGNDEYPGYAITEMALGGSCGSGKDAIELYGSYGEAYGTVLAKLHAQEYTWFDTKAEAVCGWSTDRDGIPSGKVFDLLPLEVRECMEQHRDQAGMLLRNLCSLWHAGPMKSNSVFDELDLGDQNLASEWYALVAERVHSIVLGMCEGGLMDRIVISHGDAHSKNFVVREDGGDDLFIIDFDMLLTAPAWHDMGEPFANMGYSFANGEPTPIPPLEQRRAAAAAYLKELGEQTCQSHSHNTADDVVFDLNKGVVSRWLRFSYKGAGFDLKSGSKCGWRQLAMCARASAILLEARNAPAVFQEVLEKGIAHVVTYGFL